MYPLKQHKNLTSEKWNGLPKHQQILNIASELSRAGHWMERLKPESAGSCDERAFELIDMTVEDPKWRGSGLGELLRFRELLAERYALKSMDTVYNKSLMKVLIQMTPESANMLEV